MASDITASWDTLQDQAISTATDWMRKAKEEIDAEFGQGYSKLHPELVVSLVRAASLDFTTSASIVVIQKIRDSGMLDVFFQKEPNDGV